MKVSGQSDMRSKCARASAIYHAIRGESSCADRRGLTSRAAEEAMIKRINITPIAASTGNDSRLKHGA